MGTMGIRKITQRLGQGMWLSAGRPWWLLVALCALVSTWTPTASAENLIKQPGDHNKYAFELEPHLYFRYGYYGGGYYNSVGVGPGLRATIPLMHNGPISKLNNNIAIGFGLDVPFYNGGVAFDIPVVFQWNFYFTKIISVAGEAGLLSSVWTGNGNTRFNMFPIIQGAGRFQWGRFGVLVRVGYPSLTVGANIQF